MMAEVKIQIIDTSLVEMDVPQTPTYEPFYFSEMDFSGYMATGEGYLMFYVGGETFICRDHERNRTLFNRIIEKRTAK